MPDLPQAVADQLRPMPKFFTAEVNLARGGHALKWEGCVTLPDGSTLDLVYGARITANDHLAMEAAHRVVLDAVWRATELARLGRADLLNHMRRDRHSQRPGAGRQLSDEAIAFLGGVKAAHDERMARIAQIR